MILAGGTGGHIFPGLAVAAALRARGVPVIWLGADGGMETRLVPQHGIADRHDRGQGPARQGHRRRCWARRCACSLRSARRRGCCASAQPRAVVSFGGYAAGPGGIAARLRGHAADRARTEPRAGHDQSRAGAVRAPRADRLPADVQARRNEEVVGNPVRAEIATLPSPTERFRQRQRRAAPAGARRQPGRARAQQRGAAGAGGAARRRVEVRHQCGEKLREEATRAYADAGIVASVEPFIADMADAYAWADLVVCRAGALTLAEAVRGRRRQPAGAVPAGGRRPPDTQCGVPGRTRRCAAVAAGRRARRATCAIALAELRGGSRAPAGDGRGRARARQARCRRTRRRHRACR